MKLPKRILSLCSAIAITLAANNALAANNTVSTPHYGMPKPVLNNLYSSANAIPVVVTNHTGLFYNVSFVQANGQTAPMEIYPVTNYPQNIISIDSPAWIEPGDYVTVIVTTLDGRQSESFQATEASPNVDLYPTTNALGGTSKNTLPRISAHK